MNSITNARRVLVVDDDQIIRQTTSLKLTQAGFVVTLAASGEAAIDCLDLSAFDIVVSDVRMPGMSGIDVLRNVRIRFPHLPVILMTGLVEEDIRIAASTWGAAALFQKPVNREALVTAIHAAIEESESRARFAASDESLARMATGEIALVSATSKAVSDRTLARR